MFKKLGLENWINGRTGIKPRPLFLFAVILLTSGMHTCAYAQENAAETQTDDAVIAEVERLRVLKQQNPQAYQEHIQKKKAQLKNHIESLKQDQNRYQSFVEKEGRFKQERLQRLQARKPEAFQKFMAGRAEHLEKLSQKNPERFNQIMSRHPRAQEWHEKRRMNREGGEDGNSPSSLRERGGVRGQSQGVSAHPNLLPRGEKGKGQGEGPERQENGERPFQNQRRMNSKERSFQNRESFQAGQNFNQNAPFNQGARQFHEGEKPNRNMHAQNLNPDQMNQNGGNRPRFQEINSGNGSSRRAAEGDFGAKRERGGRKPGR